MATQYTSLLGLALPVTGELSGTWGDTVNTAITSLLDSAVAGTTTLSADTDVTLTTTTGVANQARQAIILWTANGSVTRNVTAPAQSKIYTVINASAGTQSIVIRGSGPTTGVTVIKGESAQVAWNGADFVKISSSAGDVTVRNLTVTGNLTVNSLTNTRVPYASTSGLLVDSANMTFNGTRLTVADLADSGLTAGRVVYSTTGGALIDSANLLYSGTDLTVYGLTVGRGAGAVATNTAVGANALASNSGGTNTAVGSNALALNTTASNNTSVGANALDANTTGSQNTAIGSGAIGAATTADSNTAVGYLALRDSTTGAENSALGVAALLVNTTGANNTALGRSALQSNTTASNNTAVGYQAGFSNATGTQSTFLGTQAGYTSTAGFLTYVGFQAGYLTTNGQHNVGVGRYPLYANTSGSFNTAIGNSALEANTTASNNTVVGYQAMYLNTTGARNAAVGVGALYYSTGDENTALGFNAGRLITSGSFNIAIGAYSLDNSAGVTGSDNVTVGRVSMRALTSGNYNTALGNNALSSTTTASYNTATGYGALTTNTTGANNTAHGYGALAFSTTASGNTAVGYQAGYSNTTGSGNVFLGNLAGFAVTTSNGQVFIGQGAGVSKTTGGNNTFVGTSAGSSATTGTGNTFIGVNDSTSGCGFAVTTGSKNTIIGGYTGNQGGLDIRTSSNNIVLSDGDGNPYLRINAQANMGLNSAGNLRSGRSSTFQLAGTATLRAEQYSGGNIQTKIVNNGYEDTDTSYKYLVSDIASMYLQGGAGTGSGAHYWSSAPSGTADATMTLTNIMSHGGVGYTLALQNASSVTGTGLTFPATQNASGNANTLDDYEEGTFTLTLSDSSGNNATMGGNNAWRYVKVGRVVTIAGTLVWTSTAALASASRIRLTGLPFQSDSSTSIRSPAVPGSSESGSFNIPTAQIKFGVDFGQTFIFGTNSPGNNLDTGMVKADLGNSGVMYGVGLTYLANA